jgi:voltage-dependent potassium channel beta subunit
MEYRRLGTAGMKVSAISLGGWLTYGGSVDDGMAAQCVHKAIELGINFIDVADVYAGGKSEEAVGKAIKGYKRSDLVISTKAYWPMTDEVNDRGLSRKHITESVNKSLKRLGTDYVDIFFCHRFDDETPVEETVRAIDDLIRQGKVLYWGTSMWSAANINDAAGVAKAINANRPVVEQPRYNMLERDIVEGDLETAVGNHGMGLVVWSPLAQGVLTGKYNEGIPANSRYETVEWFKGYMTEDKLSKARAITALAEEIGTTPGALAIAWTLKNPHVASAITGASRPEQVAENIAALDVKITDELNQRIEGILQNKPEREKHN